MASIQETGKSYPPFEQVVKLADEGKQLTVKGSEQYGPLVKSSWDRLINSTQYRDGAFWMSESHFKEFWHSVVEEGHLLPHDQADKISHMVAKRGPENHDWYDLAGFMVHDIHHLRPNFLFQGFLMAVDVAGLKSGDYRILEEHKLFFDDVVANATWLAGSMSLPYDFVKGVVSMEMGKAIETKAFKPMDTIKRIAYLIKGRFAVDDYEMLVNPQQFDESVKRNRLIINAPQDLSLNTNEAMIFSVIYNLTKNAAKANAEAHFDQNDQALSKLYYKDGSLEKEMSLVLSIEEVDNNIMISVADQGEGLSIDSSLKRIHKELSTRLQQDGIEQVKKSEWFWNIKRALGEDQSEMLLAWPEKPNALRELTVGTIFDCQFVAGFTGSAWELRSFTSGTGLWGVRYLTERLGGSVIGTNKFDGGALFSVTLPKASLGL